MKKSLILALLITLLAAPLAIQTTTAQDEVTISILGGDWWFDPEGVDTVGLSQGYTLMQQYMEMHPEVTFDVRGVPFPELDNTQFAAMEAGEGPDILIVNSVTIGAFIDRGYLMPMDEYIAASGLDTSVFYESLFAAGKFQDFTRRAARRYRHASALLEPRAVRSQRHRTAHPLGPTDRRGCCHDR